jgi:hypothetical protein
MVQSKAAVQRNLTPRHPVAESPKSPTRTAPVSTTSEIPQFFDNFFDTFEYFMGKHSIAATTPRRPTGRTTATSRPRGRAKIAPTTRKSSSLLAPFLASMATVALVLVIVVDPYSGTYASAALPAQWEENQESQTVALTDGASATIARESFSVTEPPVVVVPAAVAEPGSAKSIALGMVTARGWNTSQYNCLVSLWTKESSWNLRASNSSSGAYGIPQALPGSKMASAGSDWQTNAATQISWGLGYISGRYSTPCGAWTHSQAVGWY